MKVKFKNKPYVTCAFSSVNLLDVFEYFGTYYIKYSEHRAIDIKSKTDLGFSQTEQVKHVESTLIIED